MQIFINNLYFALPILFFVCDVAAIVAAISLKSSNALLFALGSALLAAICAYSSPLSTTVFFRLAAPLFFALLCLLATQKSATAALGFALASALFLLLAYAAIHTSSFMAAALELSLWPQLGFAALLVAWLPRRSENLLLLAASCWQYCFSFAMSFAGAAGLVVLIKFFIHKRRKLRKSPAA